MAETKAREEARELIKEGSRLAEEGASKIEAAYELMGKPFFAGVSQVFGASGTLHDLRALSQRLDAFARSDIYHDQEDQHRDSRQPGGPTQVTERQENNERVGRVLRAAWGEIGTRRWFGKHVEEDEITALETDLRSAIAAALRPEPRENIADSIATEFESRSRMAQEDSERHRARGDDEAAQLARERERVYRHAASYVQHPKARSRPVTEAERQEIAVEKFVEAVEFEVGCMEHYAAAKPGMLGKLAGEMAEPIRAALDAFQNASADDPS